MHNRAHPRHYRSEYVRGYLHRQADVYSLPGWSLLTIPYVYRVKPHLRAKIQLFDKIKRNKPLKIDKIKRNKHHKNDKIKRNDKKRHQLLPLIAPNLRAASHLGIEPKSLG